MIGSLTSVAVAYVLEYQQPLRNTVLPSNNTPPNSNHLPIATKGSETDACFHVSKTPLNKDHSKLRLHFVCILGSCYWEGKNAKFEKKI